MPRLCQLLASYAAAFSLLVGTIPQASSKDLNVLIRITYAAFLAEQGSSMCDLPRVHLSDEDQAVFSNARNYADLIKRQVTTDLTTDDIQFVLRSAADRARGEMLQVITALHSRPSNLETAALIRWCTTTMKDFVIEVLGTYSQQHDVIEQLIRKSKEN